MVYPATMRLLFLIRATISIEMSVEILKHLDYDALITVSGKAASYCQYDGSGKTISGEASEHTFLFRLKAFIFSFFLSSPKIFSTQLRNYSVMCNCRIVNLELNT